MQTDKRRRRRKREQDVYTTWYLRNFPVEVRVRFQGLATLLGLSPSALVEEAVVEWMMNHADDITNIVLSEYDYLKANENEKSDKNSD